MIIQLLIKYNDPEFQYLAYLLYDLLSNDTNNIKDNKKYVWSNQDLVYKKIF